MATRKRTTPERKGRSKPLSSARLDELIEAAIEDACGESEQITGFYTMLEENLTVPFKTEMLGVDVTVARVDITDDGHIVVVCTRGKARQRIPVLDLPMPDPPPAGGEWIDAFRRWTRGR